MVFVDLMDRFYDSLTEALGLACFAFRSMGEAGLILSF
jgi:hypothetical protein